MILFSQNHHNSTSLKNKEIKEKHNQKYIYKHRYNLYGEKMLLAENSDKYEIRDNVFVQNCCKLFPVLIIYVKIYLYTKYLKKRISQASNIYIYIYIYNNCFR